MSFGVRLALGATSRDVVGSVLADGLKLAGAGAVAGVIFGILMSRLLGNLLYGVSPHDPLTFFAACVVAILSTALACYAPALRALRADPMTALRSE